MALRYERSEYLAFASCQIVASSNEDRVAAVLNHKNCGISGLSSFGVYDGHSGSLAADTCSASLHDIAIGNFQKLLESRQRKDTAAADKMPDSALADVPRIIRGASRNEIVEGGSVGTPREASENTSAEDEFSLPIGFIHVDNPIDDGKNSSYEPTHGGAAISAVAATDSISKNDCEQLLTSELQNDALLCEGIRQACLKLGKDNRSLSESGTTVSSLILRWGAEGEDVTGPAGTVKSSVRVYCTNVGDSRCVQLRTYETKDALISSSSRRTSLLSPQVNTAPPITSAKSSPVLTTTNSSPKLARDSSAEMIRSKSHLGAFVRGNAPSSSSARSNRFVAVHLMSEDHKLSLHRERLRIINTTEGRISLEDDSETWHPLPADASAIYLPQYAKTPPPDDFIGLPPIPDLMMDDGGLDNSRSGPFGRRSMTEPLSSSSCHGYMDSPSRTSDDKASMSRSSCHGYGLGYSSHSQSMHSTNSVHDLNKENSATSRLVGNGLNKYFIFDWGYPPAPVVNAAERFITDILEDFSVGLSSTYRPKEFDKIEIIEPPLSHKISFIKQRSSSDGKLLGPEALFSRHNTSIMMTRSIGDRHGPRSCISLPEISACTIPIGTHARFILASDGFWDVVSVDTVRCVGLIEKYKDPRVLASQLAQKALRRRERADLRRDDITVMVVDVNPMNFISVGGKYGGDGALPGDSKDKCIIS